MAEKLSEVYEQYDMEILSQRKGRGATILMTTKGPRILEPFRGSLTRLEQEYVLKQLFEEEGYKQLDSIIPNLEGQLVTNDKYRQPFVLKKHFEGTECDMREISHVKRAVSALADFHIYGRKVVGQFPRAWKKSQIEKERKRMEEIRNAIEDGEDLERIAYLYEISQSALYEMVQQKEKKIDCDIDLVETDCGNIVSEMKEENLEDCESDIEDIFIRHNKELKKIQKFVLKVNRKNSFESLFLQVFEDYYKQGMDCVDMLSCVKKDNEKINMGKNHYGICHGSYNQHNVIMGDTQEFIVHFERFSKGNQLNDLYQFSRKVMEKNHFDMSLLKEVFETYSKQIELTEEDYHYLYILFSYPEKFWKIANSYYNTNKAFLSPKYVEKLKTVILQEEEKKNMLKQFAKL